MFGRIIVATDLTAGTRNSLRAALDLRHSEGEILLLHVIRRIAGIPDAELEAFYDRLRATGATRMLELTGAFARQRAIDIPCVIACGDPAHEIVRMAADRGADLIVLTHDAEVPTRLGSVSYKVAHLAPCAVLMLRAEARIGKPPARGAGRAVAIRRPPLSDAPVPTPRDARRDNRRSGR